LDLLGGQRWSANFAKPRLTDSSPLAAFSLEPFPNPGAEVDRIAKLGFSRHQNASLDQVLSPND